MKSFWKDFIAVVCACLISSAVIAGGIYNPSTGASAPLSLSLTSTGNANTFSSTLTGSGNTGAAGYFTNTSTAGYGVYSIGQIGGNSSTAIAVGIGGPNVSQRVPNYGDDYTKGYFGAGSIDHLYLTTVATGCSGTPTLTIGTPSGTGGTTATGHFVMDGTGGTLFIAVVDYPGKGYTANPTVTVGNTTGCNTTPVVSAFYKPNGDFWLSPDGVMYQAQTVDAGSAVWSQYPTPALPLDSVTNPVSAATVVGGGGVGYAVNDTITIANGTILKVATLTVTAVATVTVQTAGNWTCPTSATQAQISSSGGGTGATFTVNVQTAVAAYGDHLLTQCYTANKWANVINETTGATLDIGFINGVGDVSTMQNFCGTTAANCKWVTLYDQSGGGNNATQGTDANRPLVDFGQNLNGFPVVYSKFMTISSGAAYSSTNETAYILTKVLNVSGGTLFTGPTGSLFANPQGRACFGFVSGAGVNTFFLDATANSSLIGGTTLTSSTTVFSDDDYEFKIASGNATGALTGGTLGAASSGTNLGASAFFLWPRAFSTTEMAQFRASVYKTFNVPPQIRDIIEVSGDSRSSYAFSTDNVDWTVQMQPKLVNQARVMNGASYSGRVMSDAATNFYSASTNSGHNAGDAYMLSQKHGPNTTSVVWLGWNDISVNSQTGAQVYANMQTFVNLVHGLGEKVSLETEVSCQGTGITGQFAALDTLVTANTARADFIVPLASDPMWGSSNYWTPQNPIGSCPHPNTYGYSFVANDMLSAINPSLR